jgi:hypothetical protein
MKRLIAVALLGTLLLGVNAIAAGAVDGPWKRDVAKSKLSGAAPNSGTRAYTESKDGTTLDAKAIGADGKAASMHVTLTHDGKAQPITGNPATDGGTGKAIDAHTTGFTLSRGATVADTVHRAVSADGRTLTVHNAGTRPDGTTYDDTLVIDRQ